VNALHLPIDVSVVYAEAASRSAVANAAVARGNVSAVYEATTKAMESRAREKRVQYEADCAKVNMEFSPFVLDSHGSLHESAENVIEKMADAAHDITGRDKIELTGYIKRLVSVATQRGNALLDRTARNNSANSIGYLIASGLVLPRK